ncbi:MAG: hypothetical protein GX036_07270 [Firmicutes bacterium]|nr:hypothetical protein [Bacillota bacterium]
MPRSPLYPYPPVQYIPLYLEPVFFHEPVAGKPLLLVGWENIAGRPELAEKYGCSIPQPVPCREKILILTAGVEPLEAKYRGCYVTIKGRLRPCLGLYHLPATYFYRSSLVFQVKDENGEKLLSQSYQLPAGTPAPASRMPRS